MFELTRRNVLAGLVGGCAAHICGPLIATGAQPKNSKQALSEERKQDAQKLADLYPQIEKIFADHGIAGGSVAVARGGDIIFDQGFGMASVEFKQPVKPETLFSLASVSKSVTAIGVLKLVEDGKLRLDAFAFEILKDLRPHSGQKLADLRFRQMTVRHLLFHGSGLQLDAPDPPNAKVEGTYDKIDCENRYRQLLTKTLVSDPGTEFHYSNAGFLVLRLIIEKVAGREYEAHMREHVLRPMGIRNMRMEQAGTYKPGESHRYLEGGEKPAPRILGNWLAAAGEIVKFTASVAGSGGRKTFLDEKTTARMFEMPATLKVEKRSGPHVGLGWDTVVEFPDGRHRFSKNGGKPGVQAWLEHLEYDVDWAVLCNTDSPKDGGKPLPEIRKLMLATFAEHFGGSPEQAG